MKNIFEMRHKYILFYLLPFDYVFRCEKLRDASFMAIAQYCKNLRSLNLENSYALNDTALARV